MIALRRAILMKANPVVSPHAHRMFSGRACSCKKDPYYGNVPRSVYITACDQSTVESGVTEGGKNTAIFFFIMNEHNNTNMMPKAKVQRFSKLFQKRSSS